jgi:hypothetical protein
MRDRGGNGGFAYRKSIGRASWYPLCWRSLRDCSRKIQFPRGKKEGRGEAMWTGLCVS